MRRSRITVQRLMTQIAAVAFLIFGGMGVAKGQPYHHLAIVMAAAIAFVDIGLAVSGDEERLEAIRPRPYASKPPANEKDRPCRDFDAPRAGS